VFDFLNGVMPDKHSLVEAFVPNAFPGRLTQAPLQHDVTVTQTFSRFSAFCLQRFLTIADQKRFAEHLP
jgi:hypothetical protein